MLVCLITHPGDRQLTVNLCARIQQLGGVRAHECLIVSPHGTNMDGIENVLKRAFAQVYVHQYAETMKGWPAGPNEAVTYAMLHIWGNAALRYHYLILEPDCVPVSERWLDMIDTTYRQSGNGSHVLGVKTDTRNQVGAVIGRHTVGVAVYPKNWPQICSPIQKLIETTFSYVQQRVGPPPWDAYTGVYTNRCTAETGLIQHFTVQPTMEGGHFHWDCTIESALAQVNPKAVLLHGCKNPEFLTRLTGTKYETSPKVEDLKIQIPKVYPILESRRVGERESGISGANAGVSESVGEHSQSVQESREQGSSSENRDLRESVPSRRAELNSMKWAQFKSYAASIGINTYKTPRPELTDKVLEIEEHEMAKPVEEAAPPLTPPPMASTGIRTARPWNSVDGVPAKAPVPPDAGGISDPMKVAMLELIEKRRAAGLV